MAPLAQVGLIALLALGLALWRPSTKLLKYLMTLFHEVGHAAIALLLGGRIQHIKIQPDGSGVTSTAHTISLRYKLVRIVELLAGYSFPLNIGVILLGLGLIGVDPIFMLGFTALVSLFTLLFVRNLFGLLVVLVYSALPITAYVLKDAIPINYTISLIAFLLIFGGVRDIKDATRMTFSRQNNKDNNNNDFHLLRDETLVPAKIWNVGFILCEAITVASIVFLFFNYQNMV